MGSEYVKLSSGERNYSNGKFLQSELGMLNFVKGLKRYSKLRKQEFELKVALKSKLGELANLMDEFVGLLPKTEYKLEGMEDVKYKGAKEEISVEKEIEQISKKLERLSGGM